MKKYIVVLMTALISIGCDGQNDKDTMAKSSANDDTIAIHPKGSWKVNRSFDEQGNLIRYDSIYSWSSDRELQNLSEKERDSMLNSFKSKFYSNFSLLDDQGFDTLFSKDSLFTRRYFNDDFFQSDFGKDFMNIDEFTQYMIKRQQEFLEKYRSQFVAPEESN